MTDRKVGDSASKDSQMDFDTIESVVKELDRSGRKLKKSNKGHRDLLRHTLQTAQNIIVKFLDDRPWQKQFMRAVTGKKEGKKKSNPSNWCLEVVAKATGASSRGARKLASKRAAVLELLRERNVPVKDTATILKKEGLEKLYSERCRRKKETQASAVTSKTSSALKGKVTLRLRMKRADHQQLMDQEVGTKLSILVSRVSESDGDFRVKGILAANSLGDSAGDWEE